MKVNVEIKILKRQRRRGSYIEKCWENIHRETKITQQEHNHDCCQMTIRITLYGHKKINTYTSFKHPSARYIHTLQSRYLTTPSKHSKARINVRWNSKSYTCLKCFQLVHLLTNKSPYILHWSPYSFTILRN